MRRSVLSLGSALALLAATSCTGSGDFTDDFDGRYLNLDRWNTCHWWDDGGCTIESNDELQWYLPDQVAVADGVLRLQAIQKPITVHDDDTEFPYRSGMVTTGPPRDETPPKYAFQYGTVEARVRLPDGAGLWSALWLLPADGRSRPEIDILEVLGRDPDELIMHLHPEDRGIDSPSQRYRLDDGATFADDWHVLRLDWQPGALRWFVDDHMVWELEGDLVPAEPMYFVANLAVGGVYGGTPEDDAFPATMEIDYVRIKAMR